MVKDYEFNEYNVLYIDYDNIKDKICNENKYSYNFEIEGDFNIYISMYLLNGGRITIPDPKTKTKNQ